MPVPDFFPRSHAPAHSFIHTSGKLIVCHIWTLPQLQTIPLQVITNSEQDAVIYSASG